MPNHITNIILPNSGIDFNKYFSKDGKNLDSFDFNKIIPFPEELEGISSPVTYLDSEDEMKEQIEKYKKYLTDESKGFSPQVGITKKYSEILKQKYGFDNWYDWCCANWSTKWNSYDNKVDEGSIIFNTAWSIPVRVFERLSELEKNKTLRVISKDEGSYDIIYSEYLNGESSIKIVGSYVFNIEEMDYEDFVISEDLVKKHLI